MGYTHYWRSSGFTPEQWAQLCQSARTIARRSARTGAPLRGWDGEAPAEYGPDRVALNGLAKTGDDFESLIIHRAPEAFGFCKTGRRPYDAAAVALLIVAARINPGFSWRSDGDASEHADGLRMARDLPWRLADGGAARTER
jgi:hypothetical protein